MKQIAVVSLVEEYERRKHIDSLFNYFELDFNYFDAINKQQVVDTLDKYNILVNTDRMSLGEVACYLSHYSLWQQVIDYNLPYLMVFEDDIYFTKGAKALLNDLNWLPKDYDVIKLETMYDRVMINKGVQLLSEHKLCRMKSRHMGMAGYIISRKGAKKLITMTQELGVDRPIDHIMFDRLIEQKTSKVYQVCPALCIQDKIYNKNTIRFGSCLEDERGSRPIVKVKLSAQQKFNRELARLWTQMGVINFSRSLFLTVSGYKKQRIEYKE